MGRVFVLYDRETESIWYPQKEVLRAVAGPRKGDTIPETISHRSTTLTKWFEEHPESKVLLPRPLSKTVHDLAKQTLLPKAVHADT